MRPIFLSVVIALSLCALVSATNVGGTYNIPQHWTVAGSPYIATSSVIIGTMATLTIDPGVTVKFNGGKSLTINGKLLAIGTSSNLIAFTSNVAGPHAGDWVEIGFAPGSDPASRVSYATVSYGGGVNGRAIYVNSVSVSLDHTTVSQSSGDGIQVNGASPSLNTITATNCGDDGMMITGSTSNPTVSNSTFSNNAGEGIDIQGNGGINLTNTAFNNNTSYGITTIANTRLAGLTGLTFSGNGGGNKNGIAHSGGTITTDEVWRAGPTWFLTSLVTVSTNWSLTINPGIVVRCSPLAEIVISGKLTASGGSNPIRFVNDVPSGWRRLNFTSGSSPNSQVSNVEVVGGGASVTSAFYFTGSSLTVDHITVRDSFSAGVEVAGASTLVITNSSFINNTTNGIKLLAGTVTATDSTLSNNGSYPISTVANANVNGLTGLTVAGNGGGTKNAILHNGGSIVTNERWRNALPWVLGGTTTILQGASLTIDPGTTVRSSASKRISVSGKLTAVGSSAGPIVLTCDQTSPSPGCWTGIEFLAGSDPTSSVSYATVDYAGDTVRNASLFIDSASPSFDHVTVSNSGANGAYITTNGRPSFINCNFTGNLSSAIYNNTPATAIDANLNYWGAASGPSNDGPGSGQSISCSGQNHNCGVKYEPWLIAASTPTQFITSVIVANKNFNPTAGMSAFVDFDTSLSGTWTLSIFDSPNHCIRTITRDGVSASATWDGKDSGGYIQQSGTYSYQISSIAPGNISAAPAQGSILIDNSTPSISSLTASEPYFSPNADGHKDTTTISATFSFTGTWTLKIRNSSGTIVNTQTGVGASISPPFQWNGTDGATPPHVQSDDVYSIEVLLANGSTYNGASTTTTLDNTLPVATISSPSNNQVLSNLYQNGQSDVPFVGTASDLNLQSWALQRWIGNIFSDLWMYNCTGNLSVVNSTLCTVRTEEFANNSSGSSEALRLYVKDLAGNEKTASQYNSVENFSITQSTRQLNPVNGEQVTYTSHVPILPLDLTETLQMRDKSGQVITTIATAVRPASNTEQTYTNTWNGKNGTAFIPDGPYFVSASLSDGVHTPIYNPSNKFMQDGGDIEALIACDTPIDPIKNQPFNCTYTLQEAQTVTVVISPLAPTPTTCDSPSFCTEKDQYRPPGLNVWRWSGLDSANTYRTDIQTMRIIHRTKSFSINAIVVYGTKLSIVQPVKAVPLAVRSGADGQTITLSFTVPAFQMQSATVKLEFKNLVSNSILRTYSQSGVPAGQQFSWTWDVRADNGMPVAPGMYLIIATVTDSFNSSETSDIVTTVQE